MDRKRWIVCYFLVALVGACAAPLPPVEDQGKPPQTVPSVIPADKTKFSPLEARVSTETRKDEELFLQAMHQIAGPLNQDTSATARQTLESLLSGYPQSKWSDAARTTLLLIGELDTYRRRLTIEQNMVKQLATEKNGTIQQNEQLKKDLRLLSDKYLAELAPLQQENEQLKKDLQLLKKLEIQLDRRDKMRR